MAIEHINQLALCPTYPDRPAHTLINPFRAPNRTLVFGTSLPSTGSNALQLTLQTPLF